MDGRERRGVPSFARIARLGLKNDARRGVIILKASKKGDIRLIPAKRRKEILSTHKPDRPFRGEPHLGGWYTEAEVDTMVKTVRASMDWHEGFGFMVPEILNFEREFADFVGVKHCLSINGAGTGLDMAMMALDLAPGDEVIVPAINFKAAAMSVIGQGGKVIWCEVDPGAMRGGGVAAVAAVVAEPGPDAARSRPMEQVRRAPCALPRPA